MIYIEREIEKEVKKWLEDREIIIIRGPRQAGKTTLLERTKEILHSKGVDEKSIIYISFEDDIKRLKFEGDPTEFVKSYFNGKKCYFLLDEIQYIKDVGKKLKLLFDSFKDIKLIVTGSSSFDLTNLGKYLVGRVIFLDLYPFSFYEFLKVKGERYEKLYNEIKIDLKKPLLKKSLFLDELNQLLKEYLTYGSYPRIILEENKEKKIELLKNLFSNYIEKDIVSLYGNKYRDGIVKLLKILSSCDSIIKYESLSSDSGLKNTEIKEILPILQDSFAIFIVKPFFKNLINELRKNPKIYFMDYGIRNYLSENFDNIKFDYLYENFIHNELKITNNLEYLSSER